MTAAHYVLVGTNAPDAAPGPKCYALFEGAEVTQDVTARLNGDMSGEYITLDGTPVDYAVWLLGWITL